MNIELDFEKRYRLVREIIETIVLTMLMFLVIRLAVQNFNIEGHSMEPSLHDKELILVDKWSYLFHAPGRGDVIVFVAPPHPDQDYIKRIVALPGDTITINDTTVIVDGVKLHESYVDPRNQSNIWASKTISNMIVPPDDYFVLGDNRMGSSDSRDWGFVPRENVIGRAALVYWPLGEDNNGFLPNVSAVFASVHQAGIAPNSLQSGGIYNVDGIFLLILPGLFVVGSRKAFARKLLVAVSSNLQYPQTDRRNEETLKPPLMPANGDHSTRNTPNKSSGFALGKRRRRTITRGTTTVGRTQGHDHLLILQVHTQDGMIELSLCIDQVFIQGSRHLIIRHDQG
jgi:signal peptidase I